MVELSQIKDPADIRGLSREECEELADEDHSDGIAKRRPPVLQSGDGGNHAGAAPGI